MVGRLHHSGYQRVQDSPRERCWASGEDESRALLLELGAWSLGLELKLLFVLVLALVLVLVVAVCIGIGITIGIGFSRELK